MSVSFDARRRLLADLIEQCALPDLDIARMFGSPGARYRGKLVGFIGNDARLIVKLPRSDAQQLVDQGQAEAVTMGARTMREWVAFPRVADDAETIDSWAPRFAIALDYAIRNSESATE